MTRSDPQPQFIYLDKKHHYNSIFRYIIRVYETIFNRQFSTKKHLDEELTKFSLWKIIQTIN